MTPIYYIDGHKLPSMPADQRRWRLRLIVGEMVVAQSLPNHTPGCLHGEAWTSRERDGMTHLMWKLGRADANGNTFGGPQDGGEL